MNLEFPEYVDETEQPMEEFGTNSEEEEEEFQTRVSNVDTAAPSPAPPPPTKGKMTIDSLMNNIFPMMNEIMKELSEDRDFKGSSSNSGGEAESKAEKLKVELRETGKLVKGICALFVGICVWLMRVTGMRNKLRFLDPLFELVKMFEVQISEGDCDSEFARIDGFLEGMNVYLYSFIEGVGWILNKMIDHPTLLTFVLGFLVRGLLS